MEIEEEIEKMEADKGINRLPSVAVADDFYSSNYDEINTYQGYFGSSINITEDYKNYLDTKYKREITHPLTRSEYQQYINKIHGEFIDTYVQPLWENTLKRNLKEVNEIKQSMQTFLQK